VHKGVLIQSINDDEAESLGKSNISSQKNAVLDSGTFKTMMKKQLSSRESKLSDKDSNPLNAASAGEDSGKAAVQKIPDSPLELKDLLWNIRKEDAHRRHCDRKRYNSSQQSPSSQINRDSYVSEKQPDQIKEQMAEVTWFTFISLTHFNFTGRAQERFL